MEEDDRDGEYFADVEDDNAGDECDRVFIVESHRDVPDEDAAAGDDFVSDTSSVVDELNRCCEVVDFIELQPRNEVLGGAEIPLSPDGAEMNVFDGDRRVSIVNGLEEELPMPVVLVVKSLFYKLG